MLKVSFGQLLILVTRDYRGQAFPQLFSGRTRAVEFEFFHGLMDQRRQTGCDQKAAEPVTNNDSKKDKCLKKTALAMATAGPANAWTRGSSLALTGAVMANLHGAYGELS